MRRAFYIRGISASANGIAQNSYALVHQRSGGYLPELDQDRDDFYRFHRLTREALHLVTKAPVSAAEPLGQALELWRGQRSVDPVRS